MQSPMGISNEDTICAIATPPGAGGIGVVRISGPRARGVLARIWTGKIGADELDARRLYLGNIVIGGGVIDKVMVVLMPLPGTYTGQDVVEFSCHGSPIVLKKILDACVESGARIAEPGEFTRRAFLAGKMDLAQAEAVGDLIHATSETAARQAFEQLSGKLSGEVLRIGDALADIRSFVEAAIDFPEEDIDFLEKDDTQARLSGIGNDLGVLIDTFDGGSLIKNGIRTAIVGKPNVGKSSVLNALVGNERAIVHHEPGTTRDMVEEDMTTCGLIFHLRDTAGLRTAASEVEDMGIERSKSEMANSDLVLALIDGSSPLGEDDGALLKRLDPKSSIVIINKSDLEGAFEIADVDRLESFKCVRTSAINGEGINDVLLAMQNFSKGRLCDGDHAMVTSLRHKDALSRAAKSISEGVDQVAGREPLECLAQTLKRAQDCLGEITGEFTTDDLLDRIFSSFCIGK